MIETWGPDRLLLAGRALEHGMMKTHSSLGQEHQQQQQQQVVERHDGLSAPPPPQRAPERNGSSSPQRHHSPRRDLQPARGCLRKRKDATVPNHHQHHQQTGGGVRSPTKQVGFSTWAPQCLVTGQAYERHHHQPPDGKAWRRAQAVKMREGRMRQAVLGAEEYRPYVKEEEVDRWADRGWAPMGLVEDTPMGGMSLEMDLAAAQWHARQVEFDQRLAENHELAQRNREDVQRETRRMFGAGAMGTREFVHYRLRHMNGNPQ
ncbi:hypothetical protein M406DRAFT_326418 [Cryphonectria parasitica EP155]|uniref:Uncharacterized protein n=1 Tax=Cryphonectria parasitica (strain ATCC 38755 / EP155) TaxID=660469 RepID=A0A9P4YDV6_CRYP1|nr:uncharacterized protein M406DRAFT_326418 [Cryphonectria parasitica EP155]KAF3771012.1 hypothetical protein M406DRAFT_326418 [Cryphonectria parasitica EP155]